MIEYQCNGHNCELEEYISYNYIFPGHLGLVIDNGNDVYNHFQLIVFKNEDSYIKEFSVLRFKSFTHNLYHLEIKICEGEFISLDELFALVYFKKDNMITPISLAFYEDWCIIVD